jgi:glycosyltransferase involved in cell wall biosynthesis
MDRLEGGPPCPTCLYQKVTPRVAIYVVTFRRPHLLRRALQSLISQTHSEWVARVVNDDPEDKRVAEAIAEIGDRRIKLFTPVRKRGAAANFNLAMRETECPFGTILEDDNWFEPTFLAEMIKALGQSPCVNIACCNERIWRENTDGSWTDTGRGIWADENDDLYVTPFETACGAAKICNSALLFRTSVSAHWCTPDDIPVDVTEHFRERLITQPVRLVGRALVNYAETLQTNRAKGGSTWADYQLLLIGSCFYSLPKSLRHSYAQRIWEKEGRQPSPRVTALLTAASIIPEARCLWQGASPRQRTRFLLTAVRRFPSMLRAFGVRRRLAEHWHFLCTSSLNKGLTREACDTN